MRAHPPPHPAQMLFPSLATTRRAGAGRARKARAMPLSTAAGNQTDLFSLPLQPLPRTRFLPDELRLSIVPSSTLVHGSGLRRERSSCDGFLYLVAPLEQAENFLLDGLPLNRRTPLMLTEHTGIPPWLAKLAEDRMDTPGTQDVVLRLRRIMVEDALEPEPDHSAEFASPCYLLCGC
ncbi:hypothetical protein [Acetobacter vaccinii]|uniref:hypothetical protein n=1 Tax=Acetobacter vaccinii TaxID=2592655 RepID=UPI001FEE7CAE|nr:hypothetical protein [Acetobacter vaccinii]